MTGINIQAFRIAIQVGEHGEKIPSEALLSFPQDLYAVRRHDLSSCCIQRTVQQVM